MESNTGQPMLHSINITNHYFTPKVEAQAMEHVDFLPSLDPGGILCHMAKGNGIFLYIHTEDNQVQFFKISQDACGEKKYVVPSKVMNFI